MEVLSQYVPHRSANLILSYLNYEHIQFLRSNQYKWVNRTPQYFDADFVYDSYLKNQVFLKTAVHSVIANHSSLLWKLDTDEWREHAELSFRWNNKDMAFSLIIYRLVTPLEALKWAIKYNCVFIANNIQRIAQPLSTTEYYKLALEYHVTDIVNELSPLVEPMSPIHTSLVQTTTPEQIHTILKSVKIIELTHRFMNEIIHFRNRILLEILFASGYNSSKFEIQLYNISFQDAKWILRCPAFQPLNLLRCAWLSNDIDYMKWILEHVNCRQSDIDNAKKDCADHMIVKAMAERLNARPNKQKKNFFVPTK